MLAIASKTAEPNWLNILGARGCDVRSVGSFLGRFCLYFQLGSNELSLYHKFKCSKSNIFGT